VVVCFFFKIDPPIIFNDQIFEEKNGCTPARLRQIFTSSGASKPVNGGPDTGGNSPDENLTTGGTRMIANVTRIDAPEKGDTRTGEEWQKDWEIRRKFENRIRSRVLNGIATGIANTRPLQAIDMAWDSPPIQKETYPLLMWAQGKVKNEDSLCRLLTETCSAETAAKFVKKGSDNKLIVDVPRICDFSINLVRSYVTRRHAALAALWDNLWPLLKYDPRGTDETAMLVADAMTQRVDIMADEYNFRHFLSQCDRDKLLYSESLIFPRCAWDRQTGLRYKKTNATANSDDPGEIESYVKQEGVDPVNPHKSRWFWDLGAPLANINTNNGPSYVGHWTIVPYRTIKDGQGYFNVTSIVASEAWIQLLQQQSMFFAQYFDPCVLVMPDLRGSSDPALMNDRTGNIGLYTAETIDKGVLLTEYFEKINPKVEGIGTYDSDIWIRITAAGDGTIVAAEFMPSIPACYGGINCNDNRLANNSLAGEMLPFQDMASNIISQMIQQLRISFMMLVLIDKDSLGGDNSEVVKDLIANAKNLEWWMDPKILAYSATQLKELGIMDPSSAFKIVQAKVEATIENSIKSLAQVLSLADRVVNSSPNELGQPNPREVSAREVQEQSTTVQSMYAFYNEGPREQRAAFKRMVDESLMAHGSPTFQVPVLGRYQKKTIEDAGFKIVSKVDGQPNTLMKSGIRISGKLRDLDFDWVYTSRDGAERPLNTQGAQVLQQLFVGLIGIDGVAQALGKRRIYSMLNTISRMAGAPDEFQLNLDDGEDETMGNPQAEQAMQQNQDQIKEVMSAMQQLALSDATLKQTVDEIARRIGFVPAPQVPAGTTPATNGGAPAPGTPTNGGAPAPAPAPAAPAGGGGALLQNPR
jgi:hypothetical protein